jgi:hypothetical protein
MVSVPVTIDGVSCGQEADNNGNRDAKKWRGAKRIAEIIFDIALRARWRRTLKIPLTDRVKNEQVFRKMNERKVIW